jgi:hypothetical protein
LKVRSGVASKRFEVVRVVEPVRLHADTPENHVAGREEETMERPRSEAAVHACLVLVGSELVPVYGDDQSGWSFEPGIQMLRLPIYRTLDELFFALVNLNLSTEGSA